MAYLCPHCKTSTKFEGAIKRVAVIGTDIDDIYVISEEDDFAAFIDSCAGCGQKVKASELLEAEKCDECNELIPIVELVKGEDGYLCSACYALNQREDLAGLSEKQLIRRILEMEQKLQSTKSTAKQAKAMPLQPPAEDEIVATRIDATAEYPDQVVGSDE